MERETWGGGGEPPVGVSNDDCREKEAEGFEEEELAEAKKLEQLKKSSRKAKPRVCHFCKKEGHFVRDCPEMEKLRKLSASTSSGNA